MSHALGLSVIAEGVEEAEQAEFMLANDCFSAQGYYYSPPITGSEFVTRMKKNS